MPNVLVLYCTNFLLIFHTRKFTAFKYILHVFAARPIANAVKQLRLQRDDFETLKIIGRGAFGEVSTMYCFQPCSVDTCI